MRKSETASLGVDILEREKAHAFYHRHKHQLRQILAPSDLAYLKKGKNKSDKLAEILAAKEAVFKATGGSWMGISGFKKIQLSFNPNGPFRSGSLHIMLRKNKDYVVACAGI